MPTTTSETILSSWKLAHRIWFRTIATRENNMSTDLDELLELARHQPVSQEERHAQRLSFAYGNARLSDPRITRDSIREAAEKIDQQRATTSSK
jgi:hypothetical protein